MKVVGYVRVSTQEQAKEGYSIGEQIDRLKKYCEAMGWILVEIYIDPGYSGGSVERPGLKKMIADIKNGGIDKVIVYKLDRLSRSQKDTLYLIEDIFLAIGIDFVSMTENFDTSTPFGRAMVGILSVFAQLEREQIQERMSVGKEGRAKEGKWHGGGTQPIGYNYDPITELLTVNEYEAMQVNELADLFLSGMSLRAIERLFNEKGYRHKHGVWSPRTMRTVLRNRTYIGYTKYRDTWYPGEQEAIMSEEKFMKINKLLDNRAEQFKLKGIKPGAQTSYLGGLLYCKHCGGKYTKQIGSRGKNTPAPQYYVCYSRSKKVKAMVKNPNCKNKNWRREALEELVFDEIRHLAMNPEYIKDLQASKRNDSDVATRIAIIEKEIKKLDDQISRFMDLYGIGKFTIDQVSAKVDPLNEQKEKLTRELDDLTAENGELDFDETLKIVLSFDEILAAGNYHEIRALIELLIDHIVLDNDDVTIHWKFV